MIGVLHAQAIDAKPFTVLPLTHGGLFNILPEYEMIFFGVLET
jgi:hypothetical protein